jgi:chromosomal replication initiation ATPase DnaA
MKPGTSLDRFMILDLPQRPALGIGDLFVSPSNEQAVGWIDRWPAWPSHALLISGPPASGKTHLAYVWQAKSEAPRLLYADLASAGGVLEAGNNLVIEDIDIDLADAACEEALLHAFNWTRERGGSLLMTARTPPAQWQPHLADLSSRLRSVHLAEITPPDDSLLAALMLKLIDDRQLKVSSDVLLFLLGRTDRSFAAISRLVEALDQASLAKRQKITIPLAKEVLHYLGQS